MKTFSLLSLVGCFVLSATMAQALVPMDSMMLPPDDSYSPVVQQAVELRAFQKVMLVPAVKIPVPTVVEVPLSESVISSERFLVRERETGKYVGSYLWKKSTVEDSRYSVMETYPFQRNVRNLIDGQVSTYTEFTLPEDGPGAVTLSIRFKQPITTTQLSIQLAQYVALPLTVEIRADEPGSQTQRTIVAQKRMTGSTVTFPETTSDVFDVILTYAQPLRITELNLVEKNVGVEVAQALRFLAQPGYSYEIYYDADKFVSVRTSEPGNLYKDEGVLRLSQYQTLSNPIYVPADVDGDGVRDTLDSCVQVANLDQLDIDNNGRGDACDDYDRDGRMNSTDNCINIPNATQADEDKDGIGDACDTEESRLTERNPWIPWVGMGTAVAVLLLLFFMVAKGTRKEEEPSKDSAGTEV